VNGVVGLSVVVIIGYVIAARRSAGATLGEGLFSVDFRSVLRLGRLRRRHSQTDRPGDGNNGMNGFKAGADQDAGPTSGAS
jgi:hypothetical protein